MEAVAQWLQRFQAAGSEHDVVLAVRDYLSTWTPSEIAEIPSTAWLDPASIGVHEVVERSVHIKVEELHYTGQKPALISLQELAAVYAAAANRLGQLRSPYRGL